MAINRKIPVCKLDGTTVYNAVINPVAWTDLDLSAYVGARTAFIIIDAIADAQVNLALRPKGVSEDTYYAGGNYSAHIAAADIRVAASFHCYLCCFTDSAGIVQMYPENNTATYTIKLVGFIA